MTRRDALVQVIEALHAEIAALKSNNIAGLEAATRAKLDALDTIPTAAPGATPHELKALAEEVHRLNETCRIYVNLMTANVRRRLGALTGDADNSYRPGIAATA